MYFLSLGFLFLTFSTSMSTAMGKKVGIKSAEPFYVQKILPGHFDNFQQMMSEMIGSPPQPPKIY